MIHAHIEAGMIIGEPFATDKPYVRIGFRESFFSDGGGGR
jgi:hypothetical protein